MIKLSYVHFVTAALFITSLASGCARLYPCSTFLLKDGKTLLVGHNLDERTHFPGAVFINKRGVIKTSVSWTGLLTGAPGPDPTLTWTSKFASVTFNAFGRDFPDDGMNEAGLFVGEMSYPQSKYPEKKSQPRIFISLWIQYLLDTFETVDQVIDSASSLNIDGWGWHFMAADRTGALAAIEFLEGRVVVHAGSTMPVPVLCNEPYEDEMRRHASFRDRAAGDPPPSATEEVPRFVQAADMLERYKRRGQGEKRPAVTYAFDILAALERGGTQWSFVCDLKGREAWFKTALTPKIKHVALKKFKKDCSAPVKFLDLNADFAGEANARFEEYSAAANKKMAERALAAILRISPGFEKVIVRTGGAMEALLSRFAGYPETTTCAGKK